ncbi:MAG: caspase domain-containing protein [Alloprevotella sp.]
MKLRHILFGLLFLSALAGSVARAQKTYVVSVGIGNYLYPEIAPPLPCSVGDARALSHFFHDYNNSSVFMLLESNATRDHILRVLEQEFSKSTANDEIIFAYSGHGLQGGLTCYETKDASSIITYNEIQSIMKRAKARRKVMLVMACYSGGLNLGGSGSMRRTTDRTSVMIYTSSRPDEVSWENKFMTNSFFVQHLLAGMRGKADRNGDNKVTARELFNYVNPRVVSDTEGKQHPQMWGKFDDSMVVVYVK